MASGSFEAQQLHFGTVGSALWGGRGGADEADEAPEADGIAVLGEGASLRPAALWHRNEPWRSRACHQPLARPQLGGRRCPQRDFESLNVLVLAFLPLVQGVACRSFQPPFLSSASLAHVQFRYNGVLEAKLCL